MASLTNILEGMGEIEVERLEKVARRLIDKKLSLEKVEGKRGTIYLAHGLDLEGKKIGLWGYKGVAHDFEFSDTDTRETITRFLADHAHSVIEELINQDKMSA